MSHPASQQSVPGEFTGYRALFEHARAAILFANDEARYVEVNPAACQLLGYSREELLQLSIWDVSAEGRVDEGQRLWRQFIEAGQLTGEYEMRRKDGTIIPVEFSAVANVRPGLHLTINRDISDRRRAEGQLRASQSLLEAILSSVPIVVFALDKDGVFTLSTGKALAELGLQPNEYVGRSSLEVYAGLPEITAQIRRALAGDTFSAPSEVGGRIFQTWYAPQFDSSGRVTSVLGVGTDLTERRHLEEQLRQAHRLESVGLLAGGIAHDFNNLLTAIRGYADLLLAEMPPGHPNRGDVDAIVAVADRAALLTYQLLAFGRKQILRPTPLNLAEVVADLAKMLRRVIGEDIEVVIASDPALATVSADQGQIAQVIMNLVVNARDAMPGGGTLTIETANVEIDGDYAGSHEAVTPGRYVMLAVSDTGIGMPPEIRERVFEPFFTTKPPGKGSGMGLATVYGIVKQSGGHVWAYSEVARGSTFKVYLPAVMDPRLATGVTPIEPRKFQGTETVLLVEDEQVVRHLVKRGLESAGYSVIPAGDGEEALAAIADPAVDVHLVLTDVVMPRMSGRELVDRLLVSRPSVRVLFMSGYTDEAIVHHGVLDEGVQFIQKPFAIRALLTKVRDTLDGE